MPRHLLTTTISAVAAACLGTPGCATRHPPARNLALVKHVAPAVSTAPTVRLVTFNIHGARGDRVAAAFRDTPELRDAGIVLLEEVERPAQDPIDGGCAAAAELGMHCVFAPAHGLSDGGDHGIAVLSRWPLTDVRRIALPFENVVLNTAPKWAIAATVGVEGRPLRVIAVHLDNRINPAARRRQLAPVLDAALAEPLPTVVAGDMNTSPFVFLGHLLPIPAGVQDDRLEAFVRARGLTTPVTGSGPTSRYLSMRLDAIYARDVAVDRHGVARSVAISDHLPLWADLRW